MILYTAKIAPNPRRVMIFAAEKGIELDMVEIDLRTGEHKSPTFIAKNPSGKIPVLELEDGTCIAETIAISRYLESVQPEPNLFGETPLETAHIEMYHRFLEHELFTQVGISWVNGPIVAATGLVTPIEAAKARSDAFVHAYFQRLDEELSGKDYIAAGRFTVADITGFCVIDFAETLVGLKPDPALEHVANWRSRIAERDSIKRLITAT